MRNQYVLQHDGLYFGCFHYRGRYYGLTDAPPQRRRGRQLLVGTVWHSDRKDDEVLRLPTKAAAARAANVVGRMMELSTRPIIKRYKR